MKLMKGIFLLCVILALFSCNRNPLKVDVSKISDEVKVVDFGGDLFDMQGKDTLKTITELRNKYPDFFNLYTYRVIRIGGIKDEYFQNYLGAFLNDSLIREVKVLTDSIYNQSIKVELKKGLIKAFKHYKYHFPEKELPTVYTYISGFNQSVVTANDIVGISLDKYLGSDCRFYKRLSNTPQYKVANMRKDKILSDVAYAWAKTEFDQSDKTTNLLDNIIENGKMMYFVDAMLPDMPDSLKMGYSAEQIRWCYANEPAMWTYLIEHKMLYTTKRMNIVRYINPAPNTSGFPLESPGRTGVWIGWQIVRLYMKKHPDVTLPQLMNNCDYQKILNESGYNPE